MDSKGRQHQVLEAGQGLAELLPQPPGLVLHGRPIGARLSAGGDLLSPAERYKQSVCLRLIDSR
jgi:hypothetical protein